MAKLAPDGTLALEHVELTTGEQMGALARLARRLAGGDQEGARLLLITAASAYNGIRVDPIDAGQLFADSMVAFENFEDEQETRTS